MLALAEELGKFVEFVGGPEYAHVLLQPLETICAAEETVVRDKAVEALVAIAAQMPVEHLMDHFVAMLKRLASSEWYSSRIAACGLFTSVYPRAPASTRAELRQYAQLLISHSGNGCLVCVCCSVSSFMVGS